VPMMSRESRVLQLTLTVIFALVVAASSGAGQALAASSPWVQASKAKARLVTGGASEGAGSVQAFVEIELEPGWKTYWRTPGDAGGLPPSFDWSKSTNLASADVTFPAPQRFTDKSGSTIGYKNELVLPVMLKPERADAPISLVVGLSYGICKDICIPVEAELALEVPTDETNPTPAEARQALDRVPRAQDKLAPGDPVLVKATSVLDGAAPKITIEARFPKGAAAADAFLEAPDGLFLPLPELIGDVDAGGAATFEAPLGKDVDLVALKGKPVTVTLVSETGASFATFVAQ
jgi:DsbC/DsbD-like thiol-disulfide interchange protein